MRIFSSLINQSISLSGRSIALLSFTVFCLCAVQYGRLAYYRDPTSLFFDPQRGYQQGYSTVRRQEADTFIESASKPTFNRTVASPTPKLCIGIASVARDGARYFPTSVGSLLAGLTTEERQGIYLVLFIAHTNPQTHPVYAEAWVENVADRVLTYDLPTEQLEHIRQLEDDRGLFREKALFDYTYLLKACAAIDAAYILMMEDDVIALDGWYHRTWNALESAEKQSHLKGSSNCKGNVIYLRLFYTEEFLGWNSEEWLTYLLWSLAVFLISGSILTTIRFYPALRRASLSNAAVIAICLICVPSGILFFFAFGRVSMLPLKPGVNEMPRFGCCSQSFVFPQSRAGDLIAWYEARKVGFVDMLTEQMADERHELRWALTPSVMQHIGRKSSKGDDYGKDSKHDRTVAEKLWNFAFERNDPGRLREEHLRFAGMGGQGR